MGGGGGGREEELGDEDDCIRAFDDEDEDEGSLSFSQQLTPEEEDDDDEDDDDDDDEGAAASGGMTIKCRPQIGQPSESDFSKYSHHFRCGSLDDDVLRCCGDPDVSFVFGCFVRGNEQLSQAGADDDLSAMPPVGRRAADECFECGSRGHWSRDCPHRISATRQRLMDSKLFRGVSATLLTGAVGLGRQFAFPGPPSTRTFSKCTYTSTIDCFTVAVAFQDLRAASAPVCWRRSSEPVAAGYVRPSSLVAPHTCWLGRQRTGRRCSEPSGSSMGVRPARAWLVCRC